MVCIMQRMATSSTMSLASIQLCMCPHSDCHVPCFAHEPAKRRGPAVILVAVLVIAVIFVIVRSKILVQS